MFYQYMQMESINLKIVQYLTTSLLCLQYLSEGAVYPKCKFGDLALPGLNCFDDGNICPPLYRCRRKKKIQYGVCCPEAPRGSCLHDDFDPTRHCKRKQTCLGGDFCRGKGKFRVCCPTNVCSSGAIGYPCELGCRDIHVQETSGAGDDRDGRCLCCPEPVCEQPKEVGPCNFISVRYYHDEESGLCLPFDYGGCLGNQNNFLDKASCEAECLTQCNQPSDPGDCDETVTRYFYNRDAGQCLTFDYSCGGNSNNFESQVECSETCICTQPMDVGSCEGTEQRFYFDTDAGLCLGFTFGGCDGNNNNFETIEACDAACPHSGTRL